MRWLSAAVAVALNGNCFAAPGYGTDIVPLIGKYCLDCHSEEAKKGELDLERFETLEDLRADTGVWQKVILQIEDGEMPPKKKPQLKAGERELLLSWTRGFLRAEALRNAGDPGPTLTRRLNNSEYTYTIRDLTGVASLDPAAEFPADGGAGEGFTNAAAALSTSPALVEKYLAAAKVTAAHAVLLPDGFRFEASENRRDWTNAIVDRIRAIYLRHSGGGAVDFSYRAQVGGVVPTSPAEGVIAIEPYLEALRKGERNKSLNSKYLDILAAMLRGKNSGNPLLDDLRQAWRRGASTEELKARVVAWQKVLWRFDTVGHFGMVRPWQVAVDPVKLGDVAVRSAITPGQRSLFIGSRGPSRTRWKNPRFVKAGREPLPLSGFSVAAAEFEKVRDKELPRTAEYLAALQAGDVAKLDAIAEQRRLDPRLLRAWSTLIGQKVGAEIRDYFTQFQVRPGSPGVGSWDIPGIGDLSLIANAGDTDQRIPGLMRAGKITVHPRPERPTVVGWRSPIAGEIRISGEVIDAHDSCGNGVHWSLESNAGGLRRVLVAGDVELGKRAAIGPLKAYRVAKGELLSLVIDARDKNHSCDLTEIDLLIEGGDLAWSLSGDCAPNLGAGNPHPDQHGNAGVWHFYSPPPDGAAPGVVIPNDSALARWMEADAAGEKAKAAADLAAALAGKGEDSFTAALRSPQGPLFASFSWSNGAAGAPLAMPAGQVQEIPLPAGLVDGWEFIAEVSSVDAGGAQFIAGPERPAKSTAMLPGSPISVGSEAGAAVARKHFDEFRALFPIAVSYTRIVPIDEVVTLLLFHREDEPLCRLMLSEEEKAELDRLWAELYFVSREPLRLVTGYEQLWQFATQDSDPKKFEPLEAGIRERAAAYEQQLLAAETVQLDALVRFAGRAYRRPLEDGDEALLRGLYKKLRTDGMPHRSAFRLTLARVLSSPHFLFKVERPAAGEGSAPVSGYELANRMSYMIWASAPDAELMQAAAAGQLADSRHITAQARRMLRDPKARRLAIEFGCQWLGLRDFDQLDEKSERHFPGFAKLRSPMYEEVINFFTDFFSENRSVLSLLDGDETVVDEAMASFYGLSWGNDQAGTMRVGGMRDIGRGGVLGMAAPLARQSGASRTSPILRGNWVYEVLLGKHLPKPPKDVPVLPETPPEGLTERQLIERHSAAPECAKCHAKIDPYGFALEAFDGIGRARKGAETSTLAPDGQEIEGIAGLRDYLLEHRRDEFLRQFCRKLLGFSLGRGVMLSDEPLIEEMMNDLGKGEYRVDIAIGKIVTSRQFREIRGR